MAEEICVVPGCNNQLSEDRKGKKKVVCSDCEAAKMHICEVCSKKLSPERIRNGATLCKECEMEPADFQGGGGEEGEEIPGF